GPRPTRPCGRESCWELLGGGTKVTSNGCGVTSNETRQFSLLVTRHSSLVTSQPIFDEMFTNVCTCGRTRKFQTNPGPSSRQKLHGCFSFVFVFSHSSE